MNASQIQSLARPSVVALKPYSSAREEFTGKKGIFLDANENPYNEPLNRYPDPLHKELRQKVAELKKVKVENIIAGNGSDEVIDMLYRTFCEPGKDKALSVSPSYGMYKVSADVNAIEFNTVLLHDNFGLPAEQILGKADQNTKLLFVCSPNNPTSNRFEDHAIEELLMNFKGLVVIDEAYADFNDHPSWVNRLNEFPNLVVLQTLSKAWGLAGIRLGMGFAHPEVIALMMKIKPPYNVNALTQKKAVDSLQNYEIAKQRINTIIKDRNVLMEQLSKLEGIKKVFPSDANFFLVKVEEPLLLYEYLTQCGIIVRNRSHEPLCEGCLRITAGTKEQNDLLFMSVKSFFSGSTAANRVLSENESTQSDHEEKEPVKRTSLKKRQTKETSITVEVSLDGTGHADISTGLGFYDHMLDQIARHSGCDVKVKVDGDLHVDEHHTLEDTAIALGEAFLEALGDKRGIERYGFALPMDDCAALVLIDFGGRPELVWKAKFKREKVGDLPTEMFEHIFKSFAVGARCNLYIQAKGKNEHHKIEAIFKAFAKSIKMAVKQDPFNHQLPSTKGVL
ncbi:MAG: histidinol-phosphate transaminase [Bacteroidales bacterium]